MNQQEKQYAMCLPVCEQNQCKHAFLAFLFVSINSIFLLTEKQLFVCFLLDSRTHLCNDHVLSGSQGRHLLCIDIIPNLSAPPPKDTGEISFMLIHLTSPPSPPSFVL